MNSSPSLFGSLRRQFHARLQQTIWGTTKENVPSNADKDSKASVRIAGYMLEETQERISRAFAQTSGKIFTEATLEFLSGTFSQLEHIRPGPWKFSVSQASIGIAAFHQYEHLATLEKLLEELEKSNSDSSLKNLRAMFAGGYLITPDIVIAREPISDEAINGNGKYILASEEKIAAYTPLRKVNSQTPILHASISCKWTLRSDRAQNARTEALNLIRNRKGNTPHIVVVTGEPLPSRLSSLALGTGDIDCVYHMALFELEAAINKSRDKDETSAEMFDTLVQGRRLRDISDLPFDLVI